MKKTGYILRFLGSEKISESEIFCFAHDDYGKSWTVPSASHVPQKGPARLRTALHTSTPSQVAVAYAASILHGIGVKWAILDEKTIQKAIRGVNLLLNCYGCA